eukprot:9282995-Ditylum_brightwellii.AAC.1
MENVNQPIATLYPAHTAAMINAGILPTKITTLKELKEKEILHQQKKSERRKTTMMTLGKSTM